MKNVTVHADAEPTLYDVMDVMKSGFVSLEKRMDGLDGRMDGLEGRMDGMEGGLHEVNRRLGKLETTVEDLREDLHAISHAVDSDSETMLNHEQRILRLELAT